MNTLPIEIGSVICDFLRPTDVKNYEIVYPEYVNWEYYRSSFSMKIIKKYMKNMRYTKMHTCYNKSPIPVGLLKMLKNNTYSFDAFFDNFSLETVVVPSHIWEEHHIKKLSNGITRYIISRCADIAKGFIISGHNIRRITISIGGSQVWETKILGTNLEWIQPFISGILLLLLPYNEVHIDIQADVVNSVKVKGLCLSDPDRHRLVRQPRITIPFFDPLHGENELRYAQSIFGTKYILY